jgi:ABC-2 type transport system ATP-binding protein
VIADGRIVADGTPASLGGRATARATVRWDGHVEHIADPAALVKRLAAQGADLSTLTITRPTLEDMYLSLIGENR